jgi:hypothetical protein
MRGCRTANKPKQRVRIGYVSSLTHRCFIMSAVDVKRLLRSAWQCAKKSEGLSEDDPLIERIEGKVIHAIAELDVASVQRAQPFSSADASSATDENENDPTISAAA